MLKKLLIAIFALLVVSIGGGGAFLNLAFPKVGPARDYKVAGTPEQVERGRYLATNVAACIDCHSTRNWTRFAGPIVPGTEGKGGEQFTRRIGFPGEFWSRNITPTGVGAWSDGELERAITSGVAQDGRSLFPMMPYPNYANMCQDDVDALIAYVRTLSAKDGAYPPATLDFPMSLIVKTIPKEMPRPPCPDKSNVVEHGRYLTTAASCMECHTKVEKGKKLPGMDYAGGREFKVQTGTVTSANITPDADTGIGTWDKQTFIDRFQGHASIDEPIVPAGEMQTVMSWQSYGGMSVEDLGAIYEYLRTVTPVNNQVVRWKPKS